MRVIIMPEAEADLEQIADYIAQDSPKGLVDNHVETFEHMMEVLDG